MQLIAPNYYPAFRCIADKCRHSCCIGWEIDIDPDARACYRQVPGAFGVRLNAAIDDGEVSSFRLGEGERCPMLNANGLCDLITELGEDALCQICADHPRFRSFFTGRTEIGLGLCCEEAARLVLTQEAPMTLITLEDVGAGESLSEAEEAILDLRNLLMAILQDRRYALLDRLDRMMNALETTLPARSIVEWAALYRSLERLDPAWDDVLDSLTGPLALPSDALETPLEQFAVYLLYRHFSIMTEEDSSADCVRFVALSVMMVMALCAAKPDCTLTDLIEFARMYSAEIEYDEDNIAALLDAMWEDE